VTHVVNLAAQAGVRYSLLNPFAYAETNVMGFVVMLELARRLPKLQQLFTQARLPSMRQCQSPIFRRRSCRKAYVSLCRDKT